AARTGVAQSLVSKVVAELHKGGVVETVSDETDRRRTRIRVTDLARSQVLPERARRTVTDALRQRLPELDEKALARIEAALDQLARQLRS
ncbi:MAG: winged helix DNA-binding protein, partial [Acidimicrobiales bacterium]